MRLVYRSGSVLCVLRRRQDVSGDRGEPNVEVTWIADLLLLERVLEATPLRTIKATIVSSLAQMSRVRLNHQNGKLNHKRSIASGSLHLLATTTES